MRSRRTPSLRSAALLLAMAAVLVMHALTFPPGHLGGTMTMPDETSSMVAAAVSSVNPADVSHRSGHATSHGDAAQACIAAMLTVVAVMVILHRARRRDGPRTHRLITVFSGPDPPVPRLSFAL